MSNLVVHQNELRGQAFVKHLSAQTLRQVAINHQHGMPFVDVDLKNQANAEAGVMREYHGRYLFELLQNANDAITAARGDNEWARPGLQRVRIELTETALIVANDGVPFLEKDVESIYRWGVSSKDPNKSVGHKGIGFKSVLEITESPQIFSQVVQFHFDRKTCYQEVRKIIGGNDGLSLPITRFVFPYPVRRLTDDQELMRELLESAAYATVIRLPLRTSAERVAARIQADIDPKLLLFLSGIDEIQVCILGQPEQSLRKHIIPSGNNNLGQEVTLAENGTNTSRWLLFDAPKRRITDRAMLDELEDQAWGRVKQVGFSLAFPMDEQGRLQVTSEEADKLFVYFPTEVSAGLRYCVHGDFYVDVARKDIIEREYNLWLVRQIATFMRMKAVPELARRFPNDARVVSALMPVANVEGFGVSVQEAIERELRVCPFVPVIEGDVAQPERLLLAPTGTTALVDLFRRFFPPQALSRLHSGKRFPVAEIEHDLSISAFVSRLGATRLSFDAVFALLDGRDPTGTSADYAAFYRFLWDWREQLSHRERTVFSQALQRTHCIVIDNGAWIAPHIHLYHAKLRQETPPMPQAIRAKLVHPKAYESPGQTAAAYQLLSTLSPTVHDYDAPAIITGAIIPVFGEGRFEQLSLQERAEIYQYLFRYWRTQQGIGNAEVDRVKGEVRVPARCRTDRRRERWLPIKDVYLSTAWTGDARLEKVFEEFDSIYFLYEMRGFVVSPQDTQTWARFWEWLGAATFPRFLVSETGPDFDWLNTERYHIHAGTQLWSTYSKAMSSLYGGCPRHGAGQRWLRRSVTLEGLAQLIEDQDAPRLALIFQLLAENWHRVSQTDVLRGTVRCRLRSCPRNGHSETIPSFVSFLIKVAKWVPVRSGTNAADVALSRPDHCWFVSRAENQIVRMLLHAPILSLSKPEYHQFCRSIGMRFVEEAGLKDFADMLRQLPNNYADPNVKIPSARRSGAEPPATFTRWVAERLNNLLAAHGEKDRPKLDVSPPLVAYEGSKLRYVHPSEAVFFDDDRYYGAQWRALLPFSPLDEGARLSARYLGLTFISEHVTEQCTPGAALETESQLLERRFKAARPYLLAIVNNQRPSMTEDVAHYLTNFNMAVVNGLVVHRRLTIDPRHTIDDVEARVYLEVTTALRSGSAGRAPRSGTLYVRKGIEDISDFIAAPIAEFIGIPALADAFVILLDRGGQRGRLQFLSTRGLEEVNVEEMRILLRRLGVSSEPEQDDELVDLDLHLRNQLGRGERSTSKEAPASKDDNDPDSDSERKRQEPYGKPELEELPEFSLTDVRVTHVDPEQQVIQNIEPKGRKRGGRSGRPDWERDQRLKEMYGLRGELLVNLLEVERLRELGIDQPERAVRWLREQGNETADHDFESLDLINGQWTAIVIEVKATPVIDFRVSMSRAEFACAREYGERYRLYRVVEVATAAPQVFVFGNPYTLWQTGMALVEPRDAIVTLPDPRRSKTTS